MYYKKGYDWYMHRYYDKTTDRKAVGECNPTFAMAVSHYRPEEIAQRIYRDFGEIKLIFVMRDPVQKLDSWYRSGLQYGWIWEKPKDNLVTDLAAGFDDYVMSQFTWDGPGTIPQWTPGPVPRTNYVKEGLYYEFLKPFLELWPREKLKFIIYEDFAKDPGEAFREILDFIGVEPQEDIRTDLVANRSDRAPKSVLSIQAMKGVKTIQNLYYHYVPFVSYDFCRRIMDLLGWMEDRCVRHQKRPPAVSEKARQLLEWYYNEDVRSLERALGRDLGDTWFPDVTVQAGTGEPPVTAPIEQHT